MNQNTQAPADEEGRTGLAQLKNLQKQVHLQR